MRKYFLHPLFIILVGIVTSTAWISGRQTPQQWTTIRIKNVSNSKLFYISFHYNKSAADTNWAFPFFHPHQTCEGLMPGQTATAQFVIEKPTQVNYYDYWYQRDNKMVSTTVRQPFTVMDGSDTTIVLTGEANDTDITINKKNFRFLSQPLYASPD